MTTALVTPGVAPPTHDKEMAAAYLAILDPTAKKFTFQFFGDGTDRRAAIQHGSLEEVWPIVQAVNTPEKRMGVFVAVNEADLQGRRRENIIRARVLFVDADNAEQLHRCDEVIGATGATPSMVVRTSRDRAHYYYSCDDLSLEEFSTLQDSLIARLGTDPAVKDLSRVMRLPGSLHLKDPACPRKVTLEKPTFRRWKVRELTTALGLSVPSRAAPHTSGNYSASNFPLASADVERLQRLFGPPTHDLSAGLETNIEEIRSAVWAIPPSAISSEPDWMKLARGLAIYSRSTPPSNFEIGSNYQTPCVEGHVCECVQYTTLNRSWLDCRDYGRVKSRAY
jgi:hypothetical protein